MKHLSIAIDAIPHASQRYETVGDYFEGEGGSYGTTIIRVSRLSDWRREFLVALHEMVEMAWARHNKVSTVAIDAFDMEYEKNRPKGDVSEPGDDPRCPVFAGHQLATMIEKAMAGHLGVAWDEYDKEVSELSQE